MPNDYLARRLTDAIARAKAASSSPARIAHEAMAKLYGERIIEEELRGGRDAAP